MRPENVNPRNFETLDVLYNNGEFSIAYGLWEGRNRVLAMRWNGEDDNDAGYPKTFGHPMWFIIDGELNLTFVRSLIGARNSNNEAVLKVLNELLTIS